MLLYRIRLIKGNSIFLYFPLFLISPSLSFLLSLATQPKSALIALLPWRRRRGRRLWMSWGVNCRSSHFTSNPIRLSCVGINSRTAKNKDTQRNDVMEIDVMGKICLRTLSSIEKKPKANANGENIYPSVSSNVRRLNYVLTKSIIDSMIDMWPAFLLAIICCWSLMLNLSCSVPCQWLMSRQDGAPKEFTHRVRYFTM